jgi:hypothetical protein
MIVTINFTAIVITDQFFVKTHSSDFRTEQEDYLGFASLSSG